MNVRSFPGRRSYGLVAAMALTLALTAACEPAQPPPTFVVSNRALAHDAVPGDGVCEATVDGGDCTFNAAIDEANALGRGSIMVSQPGQSSDPLPLLDATITGHVTLRVRDPFGSGAFGEVGPGRIHVASGGVLSSEGVGYEFGDITVDGTFVSNRLALVGSLRVEPGGRALLVNAFIVPGPQLAISNGGSLSTRYVTIDLGNGARTGIETTGAGVTHLGATAFMTSSSATGSSACAGLAPVSDGHNIAPDSSCSLAGPGDVQGSVGVWGPGPFPPPGSLLRDAIAPGTLGCGTEVRSDIRGAGANRPLDGDGDGVAACDIGAFEA